MNEYMTYLTTLKNVRKTVRIHIIVFSLIIILFGICFFSLDESITTRQHEMEQRIDTIQLQINEVEIEKQIEIEKLKTIDTYEIKENDSISRTSSDDDYDWFNRTFPIRNNGRAIERDTIS